MVWSGKAMLTATRGRMSCRLRPSKMTRTLRPAGNKAAARRHERAWKPSFDTASPQRHSFRRAGNRQHGAPDLEGPRVVTTRWVRTTELCGPRRSASNLSSKTGDRKTWLEVDVYSANKNSQSGNVLAAVGHDRPADHTYIIPENVPFSSKICRSSVQNQRLVRSRADQCIISMRIHAWRP